jgi:hypothetical protein
LRLIVNAPAISRLLLPPATNLSTSFRADIPSAVTVDGVRSLAKPAAALTAQTPPERLGGHLVSGRHGRQLLSR